MAWPVSPTHLQQQNPSQVRAIMEKNDLILLAKQIAGVYKKAASEKIWADQLDAEGMAGVPHKYGLKINLFQNEPPTGANGLRSLLKQCNFSMRRAKFICTLADIRTLIIECLMRSVGEATSNNRLEFLRTFQADFLQGVSVPVITLDAKCQDTTSTTTSISIYATTTYRWQNKYVTGQNDHGDDLLSQERKLRFDTIEFGSQNGVRCIGRVCAFLRLTRKVDRRKFYIPLVQPFLPHQATEGKVALDGSPVHPGWPVCQTKLFCFTVLN